MLVSRSVLLEIQDGDDDPSDVGLWQSKFQVLPDGRILAGVIVINKSMRAWKRHETYWHELIHVVNDVAAYDKPEPLVL